MWKTYKQVYDEVMHIGSALRASGAQHVSVCKCKRTSLFLSFFFVKRCVLNVYCVISIIGLTNWSLWIKLSSMDCGNGGSHFYITFSQLFVPSFYDRVLL